MKNIYLLIVVLLINILPMNAQISLTLATHGYVPGDVYSYYYGDTTNFNPGVGGANVTWTFTGWNIGTMMKTINYIDPKTTPYSSSFPTATYAWEQNGAYVYYKTGSTGFFTEGVADSNNILVYPDDERMYPYPFTYTTSSPDYFSGSVINKGIRIARNGKITTTGDGWGKLVINSRTYNNVLRIKIYQEISDYQIVINTGDTATETHHRTTTYHWYQSNSKNPIINYSETKAYLKKITDPPYLISKEIFVDNLVTGINYNESELLNFNIYPNPGKGIVNLESNIFGSKKLNLEIVNMSGQLVYSEVIDSKGGILNHAINVSTLPQGFYSVKLFNNETFGIRKLILQ